MSVEIEQVGPSTGQATARTHSVFVDRPAEKDGSDRGPMGGEYLLVYLLC
jgi:putative redox protein